MAVSGQPNVSNGGEFSIMLHPMDRIRNTIEALLAGSDGDNGKSPLRNLGFLSCTNTVHIKHAPFYDPCLILVLSGNKAIFENGKTLHGKAGDLLAVPGPASFDLRNEPDTRTKNYTALVIPFKVELLDRLARTHGLLHEVQAAPVGVLRFEPDETLYASIRHYLETLGNARLQDHRLMEILLILATRNPDLLSYGLRRVHWAGRVRAVLSADLTLAWSIGDVCRRLATTESTLRRHLTREGTGFRALLHELRLATALTQLLQTSHPIHRIAYDCGYQSVSRFTSNFHKRFGVPPKQFRSAAGESGQRLTA
jgi:AraC-like DNA-binding protein